MSLLLGRLDVGAEAYVDERRQVDNLELLHKQLSRGEEIMVVAEAAQGRFKFGLLAATTHRLIFIRNRVFRPPVVVSTAFEDIDEIQIDEQPVSGIIFLRTADQSLKYDTILPKDRTWHLYWRVQEHLDKRARRVLG